MQHQHQLWTKKLSTSTNIFAATALERERERDGFLALNLRSNFVELGFWIHQEFQGGFPPTLGLSLSRCYSESTIAHMFFSFSLPLSVWLHSGFTLRICTLFCKLENPPGLGSLARNLLLTMR
jgi:hypothetical protein